MVEFKFLQLLEKEEVEAAPLSSMEEGHFLDLILAYFTHFLGSSATVDFDFKSPDLENFQLNVPIINLEGWQHYVKLQQKALIQDPFSFVQARLESH